LIFFVSASRRLRGPFTLALFACGLAPAMFLACASLPEQNTRAAAYLCPMHPDIRSAAPGWCPRCGMRLVSVTDPVSTRYHLDVETSPAAVRSGSAARVRFVVRETRGDTVVRRFEEVHERAFHLFVISQDLDYFAHLHPVLRSDGTLETTVRLPAPAPYHFFADFLPEGGAPQMLHATLVTADYTGSLAGAGRALTSDLSPKLVDGLRIELDTPEQIAGREQLIACTVEDAATGAPVTDLEPYLGAWGHMVIVSEDLAEVVHSHPVAAVSDAGGPRIVFQQRFPRAGKYRVWAQFQRRGTVSVADFTLDVADASTDQIFEIRAAGPVSGPHVDRARLGQ
jgi:hypothetical protein